MILSEYSIRDLTDEDYKRSYDIMDADKKNRVDRYRFTDDKKRTVVGDMLARKIVSKLSGINCDEVVFGYNEYNKPVHESCCFSISHSCDYVVCVGSEHPVGVDIEKLRPVNLKIAKRICSEDELKYLFGFIPDNSHFSLKPNEQTDDIIRRFFEIWTAKEAYLKCLGYGITQDLKSVNTLSFKNKIEHSNDINGYLISIYSEYPR